MLGSFTREEVPMLSTTEKWKVIRCGGWDPYPGEMQTSSLVVSAEWKICSASGSPLVSSQTMRKTTTWFLSFSF